jgi:hypothetical protein
LEERVLRTKSFVLIFAGLAFLASPCFSQTFSLHLYSGLSYAGGGDLTKGIKGEGELLGADYGISGAFKAPYLGLDFGGEIVYYLGTKFGIGLGIGYFRHAKESAVSYEIGPVSIKQTLNPKFMVIPITTNLHYLLTLGPRVRIDLSAGAGFYLTTLDWESRMDIEIMGFSDYFDYTFKSTKGTIGFQGGVGLEVKIAPKLALVWTILGRYASLSELKGDWTDKGEGDLFSYSETGSEHYAWYYDLKYGGKTYSQIIFDSDKPAGPDYSDARYAKIGLTGFITALGIKLGF